MRHALHREHREVLSIGDWRTVIEWLGLPQPAAGTSYLDIWNLIAPAVGLPMKSGGRISADEWNHVVNMALARHA